MENLLPLTLGKVMLLFMLFSMIYLGVEQTLYIYNQYRKWRKTDDRVYPRQE